MPRRLTHLTIETGDAKAAVSAASTAVSSLGSNPLRRRRSSVHVLDQAAAAPLGLVESFVPRFLCEHYRGVAVDYLLQRPAGDVEMDIPDVRQQVGHRDRRGYAWRGGWAGPALQGKEAQRRGGGGPGG